MTTARAVYARSEQIYTFERTMDLEVETDPVTARSLQGVGTYRADVAAFNPSKRPDSIV